MTFEEFRDEAIRLCRIVRPESHVCVEMNYWDHGSAISVDYRVWTDAFYGNHGDAWYGSMNSILDQIRERAVPLDLDYCREVAEAMGCV